MKRYLLVFGLVFLFVQQGVFADTQFPSDSLGSDTTMVSNSVTVPPGAVFQVSGVLNFAPEQPSFSPFQGFSFDGDDANDDVFNPVQIFRVEADAALVIGDAEAGIFGELRIAPDALLVIEKGALLQIAYGSALIVEPGAGIIIKAGAQFNFGGQSTWFDHDEVCVPPTVCDNHGLLPGIITDPPPYIGIPQLPPLPPELPIDWHNSMVCPNDLEFVNTLVGIVGTTPTGALTYTIPIQVPTGTAGIQPQLAIVYNSQNNSSGILGLGFGLSGLSSISRVGQNFIHEEQRTGVTLTGSDRFALDGQRLIQTGKYFDTEMASFSEIERFFHDSYQGPQRWRVITRDGSVLSYGNSPDSRMKFRCHANPTQDVVAMWHINRMEDPNGNFIEFEYYTGYGWANQIRRIRYTGNDSANILPTNEIIFRYMDKPKQPKRTLFLAGHPVAQQKLLREIIIVSEGDTVRRYRFQYSMHMSRLLHMQKFDGAGRIIGELQFNWSLGELGFEKPKRWTTEFGSGYPGHWRTEHDFRMLGDMTGDGRADVVGFRGGSVEVGVSSELDTFLQKWQPEHLFPLDPWNTHARSSRHIADIDGDGRADVIRVSLNSLEAALSNGKDGFYALDLSNLSSMLRTVTYFEVPCRDSIRLIPFIEPHFGPVESTPRHLADFDGDGRADIIGHAYNGTKIALSTGTGFEYTVRSNFVFHLAGQTGSVSLVGDINGDGRTDIVVLRNQGSNTFSVYFALSYGDSLGPQTATNIQMHFAENRHDNFFLADVNGDGMADLIFIRPFGFYVALATGVGFESPIRWTTNYGVNTRFKTSLNSSFKVADVNGDGMADVITFHYGTVTVSLSTGSSFRIATDWTYNFLYWSSSQSRWNNPNNFRTIADVNGDGMPDLVGFDWDGVWVSLNRASRPKLIGVTDNLGRQFTAKYGLLTDSDVHTRGTEPLAFPLKNFQGPMLVCTRLITRTSDQTFTYQGAVMHQQGRGFLGFSEITAVDSRLETRVVSRFEPCTTHFVNQPIETRLYGICGRPISRTLQQNRIQTVCPTRIMPQVVQRTSYDFLTSVVQVSNFTHDSVGNLLSDTTFRGLINQPHEAVFITRNTFTASAGRNIPNRLETTESYSFYRATPNQRFPQRQRFEYDKRGNLERIIGRYRTPIADTTTRRINTVGLVDRIEMSAPGIPTKTQLFGFDSLYRFQAWQETVGLGRARQSFDVWGRVLTDTAIGGQVTTFHYDVFGRLFQTTSPEGFVTTHTITRERNIPGVAYVSYVRREGRPWVRSYLDSLGRTIRRESPNFSGTVVTETTFNSRGQVSQITRPRFVGRPIEGRTFFDYDFAGRTIRENFQYQGAPLGSGLVGGLTNLTTMHSHSGLTTSTIDPAGRITTKTFNTAGDLVLVVDAMGGEVRYYYYAPGFVSKIVAPGSAITRITYDTLGRQTSLTDPNAGTITFEHDALDRITRQVNARGYATTNRFDNLGRLWETIEGDRVTTRHYIPFGPNVGRLQSINTYDHFHSINTQQIFDFDEFGRLTRFFDYLDDDVLVTQYAYDSLGNLATYLFPSGFALFYSHNTYGFKYRITDGTHVIWELDSVNAFGQELRSRVIGLNDGPLPNPPPSSWGPTPGFGQWPGILLPTFPTFPDPPASTISATRARTNTFNALGKPIRMAINDLMDFTYEYNNRTGNMTFRKNPFSGTGEGFYFDNLNRLATGVQFDASGNITWKEGVGHFTYHPTKVHAVESIYPPLTIGSDHDIYFTPFEKVSSILCHNTWIYTTFVYGPTHLRRQMTVLFEGHIFTRAYTQNVDISTIKSCCGLVFEETKEFIFSPFGLVAIRNNGRVNAVATDHLGSIVAEFNPNLGEFEFFGYTAWGRRYRYEQGHKHFFDSAGADWAFVTDLWSYPESILDFFRRGFTGHEHLDLFGLINMNGRLYDPIIARFLSPDPFVQDPTFSQNFNRFSYAWNNPLRFIDPTGYLNESILTNWVGGANFDFAGRFRTEWNSAITGEQWTFNGCWFGGGSSGFGFGFGFGGFGGFGGWGPGVSTSVNRSPWALTGNGTIWTTSNPSDMFMFHAWMSRNPDASINSIFDHLQADREDLLRRYGSITMAIFEESGNVHALGWGVTTISSRMTTFQRRMNNPIVQAIHQGGEAFWDHPVTQIATAMIPVGGFVRGGGAVVGVAGRGRVEFTRHATQRMAERGITKKMAEVAISRGTRYFDPKNRTYNYILRHGFASGKDLLIGVSLQTNRVTTVIRGHNLINPRFIP